MSAILRCLILFLALAHFPALADNTLEGRWVYYKKIYQGQEYPEGPDSTLRLIYEFSAEGESRLYWWHEGQNDRCERRGRYEIEGDRLVDRVTWVDPDNFYGCSRDPDMQNGKVTKTPFYFRGPDWVLRLPFGGEEMQFVWKRISEEEQ